MNKTTGKPMKNQTELTDTIQALANKLDKSASSTFDQVLELGKLLTSSKAVFDGKGADREARLGALAEAIREKHKKALDTSKQAFSYALQLGMVHNGVREEMGEQRWRYWLAIIYCKLPAEKFEHPSWFPAGIKQIIYKSLKTTSGDAFLGIGFC